MSIASSGSFKHLHAKTSMLEILPGVFVGHVAHAKDEDDLDWHHVGATIDCSVAKKPFEWEHLKDTFRAIRIAHDEKTCALLYSGEGDSMALAVALAYAMMSRRQSLNLAALRFEGANTIELASKNKLRDLEMDILSFKYS